jgi:hypothetical protein
VRRPVSRVRIASQKTRLDNRAVSATICFVMTEQTVSVRKTPLVGDILSASWGYDQTNVDFYQIVSVTKTGARLRKVTSTIVEVGSGSDRVVPVKDSFESRSNASSYEVPFTAEMGAFRRVDPARDGYSVRISDSTSAYLWKGGATWQTGNGFGR